MCQFWRTPLQWGWAWGWTPRGVWWGITPVSLGGQRRGHHGRDHEPFGGRWGPRGAYGHLYYSMAYAIKIMNNLKSNLQNH